jgi:hypothetical protein
MFSLSPVRAALCLLLINWRPDWCLRHWLTRRDVRHAKCVVEGYDCGTSPRGLDGSLCWRSLPVEWVWVHFDERPSREASAGLEIFLKVLRINRFPAQF